MQEQRTIASAKMAHWMPRPLQTESSETKNDNFHCTYTLHTPKSYFVLTLMTKTVETAYSKIVLRTAMARIELPPVLERLGTTENHGDITDHTPR